MGGAVGGAREVDAASFLAKSLSRSRSLRSGPLGSGTPCLKQSH